MSTLSVPPNLQSPRQDPTDPYKAVKEVIDDKLRGILGERTAEDDKKPLKKKKEKPVKVEEEQKNTNIVSAPPEEEVNPFSIFPQPEENTKVHTEIFFSHGATMRPLVFSLRETKMETFLSW